MLAVDRRKQDFVPAEEIAGSGGSVKTFLIRKNKNRIIRCADCQVLQLADWATEATPEAPFGLFRDWQRTQTQSSVTALRSPRQQMDVRFCWMQEPPAERHTCAGECPDQSKCALSRARPEISRFSLDFDLHGCRLPTVNPPKHPPLREMCVEVPHRLRYSFGCTIRRIETHSLISGGCFVRDRSLWPAPYSTGSDRRGSSQCEAGKLIHGSLGSRRECGYATNRRPGARTGTG